MSALIDTLIADARMWNAPPAATAAAAAVRYILAILATDARGHTYRFLRCPYPITDCSRRPAKRRQDGHEGSWNNPYF
ncbi:hypothetical protein [Azospirillum endophyticum]